MRKRCLSTVYDVAKEYKNTIFIGSDLGKGTLDEFKNEMPERFFMEGISEQHIIGMAAGLAMEGKTVFVNTIATFITRRCFEQNLVDLGIANVNVRLIGNGGGLVYAPLGPTHLAFEDIALMRAIPNMTILVCSDAEEMEKAVWASAKHQGPIYFRLGKGGDPVIYDSTNEFEIGKGRVYREVSDVTPVSTGVMTKRCLDVADELSREGIKVGVCHFATIKPFDNQLMDQIISQSGHIVSVEEHSEIGGLGSIVAERIARLAHEKPVRFTKMALPDVIPEKYGSQNGLIDHYGLEATHIKNAITKYL
jgi:transketolase